MGKSVLDRGTRFSRQNDGRGKSLAYSREQILDKHSVPVAAPWMGYAPDINDDLAGPNFAESCSGIMERDGNLVNTPGFSRLGPGTLPLGVALPSPAADAEPVIGLFQASRKDNAGSFRLAVTAADPSGGTVGHLFEWNGTAWVNRAHVTAAEHRGLYTSASAHLVDFAYFPWMGGAAGRVVFCNGNQDTANNRVYAYPNGANQYINAPILNAGTNVNAESVSNYFSRLCLFNVTADGVNEPHRFMWFEPATLDLAAAGSGYFDVDEAEGPGLKCLPIADNNALYIGRGVAFVSKTGSKSAPFRVDYVTKQRGILGKKAVVSIGAGSHFGIYTDGWLVLDASGQFTELGVIRGQNNIQHKWRQTFYDDLSVTYANRTVLGYDEDNHVIIISYVSKNSTTGIPDRVLYYDTRTDSLWPDDYLDRVPTAFSHFDATISDVEWDDAHVPGDWDEQTRSWNVDINAGRYQLVHGTYGGLVLQHSRSINTKDGQSFVSSFRSKTSKGRAHDDFNIYDKLAVEYKRVSDASAVATLIMYMDEQTISHNIALNKGSNQSVQLDFITNRLSGQRFSWGFAGVAPIHIRSAQMDIFIEGDSVQKRGS